MTRPRKQDLMRWAFYIFLMIPFLLASNVTRAIADSCTANTALPPFLVSAGATPNLLLMIDNSASMYDLAYVGDQGECYDDSYDPDTGYAGYFDASAWYAYHFSSGEFEELTALQLLAVKAIDTHYHTDATSTSDPHVYIRMTGTPATITMFAAKGNFLNWAAASKFDVQKKILTGGKYDAANTRLVLESRGCLGRRYIKKVAMTNGSDTYYLTLGIRPPTASEKADASDDTTRIEIYEITENGFDNTSCNLAITELQKASPNQGQLKQYIEDCMLYSQGQSKSYSNYMAAFNHSLHNCWYYQDHGTWPPGNGPIENIKPACESVYTDETYGSDPEDITPDNRGYVCYGDDGDGSGYVGRCWDGAAWTSDACIEQALKDYCDVLEIPEVVDPSDQVAVTGEFWNIPAVLIDSGVLAQLDDPIVVLKGQIDMASAPSGLIQEFTQDLRIGAMSFNHDGSASECAQPDSHILYDCSDAGNKDGGAVISNIDLSAGHTDSLVSAINAIKATSWTPLAEAMYNAIGYYTQKTAMRINSGDFSVGAGFDPVTAYCQNNNILIITDGGSTADLHAAVAAFATAAGQKDPSDTDPASCSDLSGSTYLDDLTWYAKNGTGIYDSEPFSEGKENIKTHIVVAGTLRSTGADECSPDVLLPNAATNGGTTLYNPTNPADLEDQLRSVFNTIRAGTSAGSAASVISSSRGGKGAVYQAIFWPELKDSDSSIAWAGDVHSLFVDSYGNMHEDTNGNRTHDATDDRVVIYYDETSEATKACNQTIAANGSCPGTSKALKDVKFIWSAADWLADITPSDIVANRSTYISNETRRYMFTWNDFNADGVVDANEVIPFTERDDWTDESFLSGNRGPIPLDFGVQTTEEVNGIINWIRGKDQGGMRSRQIAYDFDHTGFDTEVYWRLGDVVHSTPVPVARPVEGYHFLYRDTTYGAFVSGYKNRRHVIYFGGNDGMLHAVNGGFYNESSQKFCKTANCSSESTAPDLGAELWAYVPYNLLPYLKCLTGQNYEHGYYVDLKPRIFDVQIFDASDGVHTGGWGTILVCGMRFGGTKLAANTLDLDGNSAADYPNDPRTFNSAYFILDITDPESPPTLLGEMTFTGSETFMGYTTAIPTVVPMKDGASTEWYLILGSGPTYLDGRSDQTAKLGVVPLEWFTRNPPKAFRIPNDLPSSGGDQGGRFNLTGSPNGFISDPVTLDVDLNADYMADAVYFGTVEGTWGNWSGKMYRLVTRELNTDGDQVVTTPSEWSTLLSASSLTNPNILINTGQPITSAAALGTDNTNYYVFFGTGRFLDANDKSDSSQQSFYGIKEPMDCNGEFTWQTVEKTGTVDSTPGAQGLLQVDQILVNEGATPSSAALECRGGGTACLPTDIDDMADLQQYIQGSGCQDTDPTGTDGWYRNFLITRERNVGQGTLLGGLITFTTYKPFNDLCQPEGLSYLYGLYFITGTAWYKPIFSNSDIGVTGIDGDTGTIEETVELGRGLSETPNLHVGDIPDEGVKTFLQTSTGAIIEVPQVNLPLPNSKTARTSWEEVSN